MPAIYGKYKERGGKCVFHSDNRSSLSDNRSSFSDNHSSPSGNVERYQKILGDTFRIASSDSYVRDMRIAEKLTELLTCLMEDAWEQTGTDVHAAPKRRLVRDVKEYIDENYKESMSLMSLAERFYINKEYLSKIFKEEYGFTVNGYIAHARVSRAKELLRFTDMTVEEISYAVGIADMNYFSRMFKRVEGMSPKKYRESW